MNLSQAKARIIPGEFLVKFKGPAESAQLQAFEDDFDSRIVETFELGRPSVSQTEGDMVRIKLGSEEDQQAFLAALQSDERVSFAEPNYEYSLPEVQRGPSSGKPPSESTPNDLDERLWGLRNTGQTGGLPDADVKATEAWELTTGDGSDKGPLIAVIDTGIDYTHPDLQANMWRNPGEIPGDGLDNDGNGVVDDVYGYNAYADSGDPMDGHSHGTHCAGTIAAVGNNGQGITGVMQEANLMAVKIFSDHGTTSTDAIVRGIAYSSRMGANITSNSWGSSAYSQAIFEAFKSHDEALHVMAAGNAGFDNDVQDNFPSNYDLHTNLAVAATDHRDQKAPFSQYGARNVDVAAPGVDIYSTVNGGGYDTYSGTSMATPHVTGGAGLLLSQYPDMSVQELKQRLIYSSDAVPGLSNISYSNGRVNFARAMEQDTVAPGAPNDFQPSAVKARGCELTWTSVGDDKWAEGAAQNIEIRVSSEPISDENYEEAELFTASGAAEVGDLHSWSFELLPQESERSFHFAMRSLDNVGNPSEFRYSQVQIPAAQTAFSETFDGQSQAFESTGNFQLVEREGRGKVYSTATDAASAQAGGTLTSPLIDLSQTEGAYLKFDTESSLSWGEQAFLLVSEDGGKNWDQLEELNKNREWHTKGVDLASFDGKTIHLRFSTISRKGRASKGIRVDNLRVLSN